MSLRRQIMDGLIRRRDGYASQVCAGVSADEYRRLVGCIRGLEDAIGEIETIFGEDDDI